MNIWDNVEIRSVDECWPWKGEVTEYGYGRTEKCKTDWGDAHRVVFKEFYGFEPKVCRHMCDNRSCCNPYHLLNGDKTDNTRDRKLPKCLMCRRYGEWMLPSPQASACEPERPCPKNYINCERTRKKCAFCKEVVDLVELLSR